MERNQRANAGYGKTVPPTKLPLPLQHMFKPCWNQRTSSTIHDLSKVFLHSTAETTSTTVRVPIPVFKCRPVYNAGFYNAFNTSVIHSFVRDAEDLRGRVPILFDRKGRLIPRHHANQVIREALRITDMPSSCKDIRAALAACLQNSDCVMIQRNTPADCLRPPLLETMPTQCQQLKKGYGECKRGMVDMRKRFRGNQPIAVSKELEGGTSGGGGQLYAGKPAFSDTVKKTDGNEPEEKGWRELENEKFRKEGK